MEKLDIGTWLDTGNIWDTAFVKKIKYDNKTEHHGRVITKRCYKAAVHLARSCKKAL